MRSVRTKRNSEIPDSLANARDNQNEIALQNPNVQISDKIYKGEKIEIKYTRDPYFGEEEFEVRYKLRRLYSNKCAYCERTDFKPDVEHYRPKGRVTGDQRNSHGYYWLCYEWTNLIPACYTCNSRGGKWDRFPVMDQRVVDPPKLAGKLDFSKCLASDTYLLSENPAVLHPEVDKPEKYLLVNWQGKLDFKDGEDGKGELTIQTCDLNRGNLILSRKKIIDDLVESLKGTFVLFRDGKIATVDNLVSVLQLELRKLKKNRSKKKPFSLVSYCIWSEFEDFVNKKLIILDQAEKDILIHAYELLK